MEAPGRLSDKEDLSMSSLSLRNVVTAVALSTVLCLAAVPATAQPRDTREPARVEASFATRVWLWLTRISAPAGTHHAQEQNLPSATSTDNQAPSVLGRAGAFDPNG
jgi:hypothetical protein